MFSSVIFQQGSLNDFESLISYNRLNTLQFPVWNLSSSWFRKKKPEKPVVVLAQLSLYCSSGEQVWCFTCVFFINFRFHFNHELWIEKNMILHLISGGMDAGVSFWGLDEICQEVIKEFNIYKKDSKSNLRVIFHKVLALIAQGNILSSSSCWNGSFVSEELLKQRKWLQKQVRDCVGSVKKR